MANLFNTFLKTLFPRKCFGCRASDFWVCEKCLAKIPKSPQTPAKWIFSVFSYQNKIIRKLIWELKFRGKYSVLDNIEAKLKNEFENFVDKNKLSGKDFFLIPIPITEKSRKTRGYNQSLLIAKRISDENKIMQNILFKNRNHIPQNKIKNRAERLGNVKNSFEVRKNELVENKIVILIDDVVTTGATLTEAKKVLKSSGAKKVFAFVVAH